jgi:NTE family protein
MIDYENDTPFSGVVGAFEGIIPVTHRFSIIPSVHGRLLLGKNIPYSKMNVMGGDIMEQYLRYQLPFAGTTRVELMQNSLLIGGMKFRQRIGKIHYLTLTGNYALSSHKIKRIMKEDTMFGCAITYGMESMFGPLEATFNYTNHSDKLGFYINLGYKF